MIQPQPKVCPVLGKLVLVATDPCIVIDAPCGPCGPDGPCGPGTVLALPCGPDGPVGPCGPCGPCIKPTS